ncbi:hypothetical protein [Antarctobacter jejuensis]|uniref:hypothetical protein n=1 Tax=Antarctobacter jejuensis TaxID=1439938 RepID=UPI003FD31D54
MTRSGLLLCLLAGTASAQEAGLADRLRALAAPAAPDLYAEDRQGDLDLITRHADVLFGPEKAAMAMFTSADCARCPQAEKDLRALAEAHQVAVRILDTARPEVADLMQALTLDTLPSYVMQDRMIRGDIPVFVLGRYLAE